MFKKNPSRPDINVSLKKTSQGYRIVQNEAFQLFTTKKVVRSIYRPDLIQMSNQHVEGGGNVGTMASGTMIQPPSHVTLPAVANWFKQDSVHQIQKDYFPQYFKPEVNNEIFSFSVKNPNLYLYYRNSMISMWRENAKKYLSPSLCRKNLLGDVSSIMRIHAFLQNWGLVNFPSKQHNKGLVISKPQNLVCYVCDAVDSKSYYVADIEQVIFQICQHCFNNNFYPMSIKKSQFRKVYYQNHVNNDREMDRSQIIRMLEIINGIPNGSPKDKDRDTWSVIQKQFPEISKQKILKTFLKLPLNIEMNAHIFENNQDAIMYQNQHIKKQLAQIEQPSVFQDLQNPILGSIAYMYYKIKRFEETQYQKCQQDDEQTLKIEEAEHQKEYQTVQLYKNILLACQSHAQSLCKDQQRKISQLTKMLIQVVISRLELKTLFVSEYEKLVKAEENVSKNLVRNNLAESLKYNLRAVNQIQNSNVDSPKSSDKLNGPSARENNELWNELDL